jgi:hypothetical protein
MMLVFELKYDSFGALAVIEHGRTQLISRNGNPFESFADLAKNIATCIPNTRLTVLDVKSCAWTRRASHSSTICYSTVVIHAPSRLTCWFVKTRTGAWRGSWIGSRPCGGCWGGCQWIPGCDTSAELTETALHYFSGYASWTWRASSKKQKSGPYVSEREDSRWFKIRNPEYS